MVHELAHQWFGNSVTPAHLVRPVAQRGARHLVRGPVRARRRRTSPWRARMRQAYRASDALAGGRRPARRAQGRPSPARRSASSGRRSTTAAPWSCTRCARRSARPAFERLERDLGARSTGTASRRTADFDAARLGASPGRDLSGFFQAWLYGKKTPPMPGPPGLAQRAPARRRREAARRPAHGDEDPGTGDETGRAVRPSSRRSATRVAAMAARSDAGRESPGDLDVVAR